MGNEGKKRLGVIPSEFIQPGVDAEYPGTGLHVKATQQEIHIYPEKKSQRKWWARAITIGTEAIGVDVKTRGRRSGIYHLDIHAGNFIHFAIEYFTKQKGKPPVKFKSYWIARKSVNFTQFKEAMRGKENNPANRRIAAGNTWTSKILGGDFEVESADIESHGRNIDVWFKRK